MSESLTRDADILAGLVRVFEEIPPDKRGSLWRALGILLGMTRPEAPQPPEEQPQTTFIRCPKCRALGILPEGGYCDCAMGRDLYLIEKRGCPVFLE